MKRPEHIDPRWWYAATWHAREMAVKADARKRRADEERIEALRAIVERERLAHLERYHPSMLEPAVDEAPVKLTAADVAERVDELLEAGMDPEAICRSLDMTSDALEQRMRRLGRKDLRNLFNVFRMQQRRKKCPDCNRFMAHDSKHCRACAPRSRADLLAQLARNAEVSA